MKRKNYFLLIFFLILVFNPVNGQGLVTKIETGLNSVINVSALDNNGLKINTSIAFFISNDGLAITSSSLMQNADSLIFYDNNGKNIEFNNIVAIHSFGDLALVHLKMIKPNIYSYLIPAKNTYNGEGEILAFMNAIDIKERLSYGKIESVQQCLIGGRIASINLQCGESSDCSPVIDNNGNFVGIFRFADSTEKGILFPV
jgi:hypothetical protein